MHRNTRIFSLAIASALLVSCEDFAEAFHDSSRFKEDFHMTHALKPGGRITLENFNGSVEIMGWEKDSVDIVGTKHASEEALLRALKIDVASTPDTLAIRTIRPDSQRGGSGARFILRVPHRVVLDRIKSSNGSVRVEGVEGSIRLSSSNGSARAFRIKGPVEIATSNASIEVTDIAGSTILRTSNGSVRADGVRGAFEASTSNAGINARLADPEPNSPIRLTTSNGGVELNLDQLRNNSVSVDTSNASITVRLPQNLGAQLRASTSHGNVTTDYDVSLRAGKISKNSIEGTIGAGGPNITLDTSNGSIRVLKSLK